MQNTDQSIPTDGGNMVNNDGSSTKISIIPAAVQEKIDELLSQVHRIELDDPKGRIHRAWAIVLIFLTFIFFTGIFECKYLNDIGVVPITMLHDYVSFCVRFSII